MNHKNIIIGILMGIVIILGTFLFLSLKDQPLGITGKSVYEKSDAGSSERVLKVVSLPWSPFIYEENGVNKGIAVDIMDIALKNLDINYDLKFIPWSRALKLVETGEADAILAATHKEDRESYLDYTEEQLAYGRNEVIPEAYLLKLDYNLFLKRSNLGRLNFESIEQIILDSYTIGVNQDFSYTPKINAAKWNTIVHFSEQESFRALMDDEMDFFLASKEVGLELLEEMGLSDEITYINTPLDSAYIFLVFSKNSKFPDLNELIRDVDGELLQIYRDGKYDEIYRKYVQ